MFRHLICQASAQSSSRLQERQPSCSQGLGLRASGCPRTETAPEAWAHSLAKVAPQTGRWAEGGRREGGSLWEGAPLSSHRSGCTCTGGWRQRRTDTCVSVITDMCARLVCTLGLPAQVGERPRRRDSPAPAPGLEPGAPWGSSGLPVERSDPGAGKGARSSLRPQG